ncbi:MAG TPA: glycosyltransferase family 1 protein, partial [Gemmatimonadales bacterium]
MSRTLDYLAREVERRGGAVRLFTTSDPTAAAAPHVVRFASCPFWAYPQLRLSLPSAAAAAAELREWGANLVHAATPFGVGLAGRAAARELGIPLVTSYHTSLSACARFYRLGALAEPGWAFYRWFHNSGQRTYCPTRAVQSELRGRGFVNTALWGRGVDTGRFSPRWRSAELRARLGAGDGRVVVAYVGRLAAEKGLDTALAAMRIAAERAPGRVTFAMAGDGPYAARCRRLAPEGTVFTGHLSGDDLSAFYASADLFVFPSTVDTFGNVLLEAMASGLPVVAAASGPTREVLGAGGGVTVPATDAGALADTILALAADPARRASLSAAGLASATARSWRRVFDGLLTDYSRVLADHGVAHGMEPALARSRRPARVRLRARLAA